MSTKDAQKEYDRLLSIRATEEELATILQELIDKTSGGRASGTYRPAQDLGNEDDPYP